MSADELVAKMPSLVDLEGARSERFMQVMDTWPKSRVSILEETRRILNERFASIRSRSISRLLNWFTDMERLSAGSFGEISKGCIRQWSARLVPTEPPKCVRYFLKEYDEYGHAAGESVAHTVHLIIKTMVPLSGKQLLHHSPFSGHTSKFDDWVGEVNSVREVMIGRLLNLLVVHNVTPHVPLIYEPFHVIRDNRNAFAMELSHMSFANFMSSRILSTVSDAEAKELLDVAVLQVCNGLLCAQKHYDFRHNDFHSKNVMMTFIYKTKYNYKVGDSYYSVPNYGMCWKLIDFGYSSSPVFHKHDIAHAYMHSPALTRAPKFFDLTDHAAELFDILRLLTSGKLCTGGLTAERKKLVHDKLDGYVETLRKIGAASDKRGSLLLAREQFLENIAHMRRSRTLLPSTVAFSELVRSRNGELMERFFHVLAARYKVGAIPRGLVFDAESSPFADGDIVLDGVHDKPITVSKDMVRKVEAEAVEIPVQPKSVSPEGRNYFLEQAFPMAFGGAPPPKLVTYYDIMDALKLVAEDEITAEVVGQVDAALRTLLTDDEDTFILHHHFSGPMYLIAVNVLKNRTSLELMKAWLLAQPDNPVTEVISALHKEVVASDWPRGKRAFFKTYL